MADHPTPPLKEDDIIEQTILRELARPKLPSARPQPRFEQEEPPAESPEEGDQEAPTTAVRWSTYVLPCFTVLFGAAFCILLVVYLFHLHQDNARYAQLGETLSSVQALSEENDDLRSQLDALEDQIDTQLEDNVAIGELLSEVSTEADVISSLYRAEIYFSEGNYNKAAFALMDNSNVTEITEYLSDYDSYNANYFSYLPALLPRYQSMLDTLVEEGYLDLTIIQDDHLTQYVDFGPAYNAQDATAPYLHGEARTP